jgi:hypothetical protein
VNEQPVTVKVKHPEVDGAYLIVNESDSASYTLFAESEDNTATVRDAGSRKRGAANVSN